MKYSGKILKANKKNHENPKKNIMKIKHDIYFLIENIYLYY
jgi:hypothetical protein